MNNPWLDVPNKAPFIAACDKAMLHNPEYNSDDLRLDAFPEPFFGDISNCKIVLLLLNPGFVEADATTNFNNEYWVREVRANLAHKSEHPFLYLSSKVQATGGYAWWTSMLKPLKVAGVSREELKRVVMSIQYLPYHSKTYHHNSKYLPSQNYQFHLVRTAISLHKKIILTRSRTHWFKAIPELANYKNLLILNNPRRAYISRSNLDNKNGAGTFDNVVELLKTART